MGPTEVFAKRECLAATDIGEGRSEKLRLGG